MKDFPSVIEFQLHNYCNANCVICPYREISNTKTYMSDSLLDKLISEVGQKDMLLIPYMNNEPFLDPGFIEKVKKINRKCPNCKIEISTNISCITEEIVNKFKELEIYDFRISFFGYYKQSYEQMMPGLKYDESWQKLNMLMNSGLKEIIPNMSITMIEHNLVDKEEYELMEKYCKDNGISFNRWGYLDRAGNNSFYKNNVCSDSEICGCEQNRPLERMHILSDGRVVICCQDWRSEVVLGSITTNSISEIWNSEEYAKVRKQIYDRNKKSIELCEKCKLAVRSGGKTSEQYY